MAFLREQDTISGKFAKAYAKIGTQTEELFYAKSLEATIEKNKADVPVLGRTNVGKKATGWSGSGTLTVYYVTSLFRKLMLDYVQTGRDFEFDLVVTNDDPSSGVGRQTAVLRHCNLDKVIAAKFDASAEDALEEELSFTFGGYELLESFAGPQP